MFVCMCPFPSILNFFRLHLNVLVRTSGGTRAPGWESLSYWIGGFDRLIPGLDPLKAANAPCW